MKTLPYILPFFLSVAIHAGVLFAGAAGREAQVPLDAGLTAVRVRLMPSLASSAATPAAVVPTPPTTPQVPQPEPPPPPPVPTRATVAMSALPLPPLPVTAEPSPLPAAQPRLPDTPVPEVAAVEPVTTPDAPDAPDAPNAPDAPDSPEPIEQVEPVLPAQPEPQAPQSAERNVASTRSTQSVARDGDLQPVGVRPAQALGLNTLEYPRLSRRLGHEGTVRVEVQVLPTGRAGAVRLVKSSSYRRLDQAVIAHLRQSTFRPAHHGRGPIASLLPVTYRFELTRRRR